MQGGVRRRRRHRGADRQAGHQPGSTRCPTVDGGFRGLRTYQFEGGCTTFRFDIDSERAGGLVDEASLAVGFLTRAEVRARMDEMERS